MHRIVDLPAWLTDIIAARATAAGMDFDEALVASLQISALDPLAESIGWAVEHGERPKIVAKRTAYSMSSVAQAASRYRSRVR